MDAIAHRFDTVLPSTPIGNFSRPLAYRRTVAGVPEAPVLLLWNVTRQ